MSYLDDSSLRSAELVCKEWRRVIADGMLWKKLIERKVLSDLETIQCFCIKYYVVLALNLAQVRTDSLWRGLSERRGWGAYLFKPRPGEQQPDHSFYRKLYPRILKDIEQIENNWRCGRHTLQRINCRSENSKGVYCLQYDDRRIVSGLRDNTIKIWDRQTLQCAKVTELHLTTRHSRLQKGHLLILKALSLGSYWAHWIRLVLTVRRTRNYKRLL